MALKARIPLLNVCYKTHINAHKTCIIPESNKKVLKEKYKLDIIGVKNINEAMQKLGLR